MQPDVTKKVANAWRNFMSSEEGMAGMAWILSQRPAIDEKTWARAGGFEDFKRRVDDLLEFEQAKRGRDDDEDTLKR